MKQPSISGNSATGMAAAAMPVAELQIHFYGFFLSISVFIGYNRKIRGYRYDGISIFKGVPYARAKRFHAPRPVEAWEGVLDVTSYGYVCPLLEMGKPTGELLVPHRYWVMNEDCQNLNVWTPAADGLYAKGINMSGVVDELLPDCEGSGKTLVQAMLNELQLNGVKELEMVSYDRLAERYMNLYFEKIGFKGMENVQH